MGPIRLITAAVAVTGAVALTSACGGGFEAGGQGAVGSSTAPSAATTPLDTATSDPTTATPTPTATATPRVTAAASPSAAVGGDGGNDGKVASSTAGGGVCSRISPSQVGAILGVPVTGSAVKGETGCTFDQGGQRGTSVTVLDRTVAQAGGMAGAKQEANSAVEGTPEDLSGIGSAAFVLTGSMFGGPDVNGAGATQVGNRIVSVFLAQHSGIAGTRVRDLEVSLLRLVAKARA